MSEERSDKKDGDIQGKVVRSKFSSTGERQPIDEKTQLLILP